MVKNKKALSIKIGALSGLISVILIIGLMILLNFTTEGIVDIKSFEEFNALSIIYIVLFALGYIFLVTLGVFIVYLISNRKLTIFLNSLWIGVVFTALIFGFIIFTLKDVPDAGFAMAGLILIVLPFLSIVFFVPIFVGSLINFAMRKK